MDSKIRQQIKYPEFWLLGTLDAEHGNELLAVSPLAIPKSAISDNAWALCAIACEMYLECHSKTLFINDLAHWLSDKGEHWSTHNLDWAQALREMGKAALPKLFIPLNETTTMLAAFSATNEVAGYYAGGKKTFSDEERRGFRKSVEDVLERDWPVYIQGMIDSGKFVIY